LACHTTSKNQFPLFDNAAPDSSTVRMWTLFDPSVSSLLFFHFQQGVRFIPAKTTTNPEASEVNSAKRPKRKKQKYGRRYDFHDAQRVFRGLNRQEL
jgi:hypothetical protein